MAAAQMRYCPAIAAILALDMFASSPAGQSSTGADPSGHRGSFVTVAPGVNLEVLDWGGTGPPLLLLAGLGDAAHVFDNFAHKFTDRFRVYGLTRRGVGASSRPTAGYDAGTLAHDILVAIGQLKIDHVILVGHSIAGSEMTKFAATYPSRVAALVYLDSAYDFTAPISEWPQQPPAAEDFASVDAYNAYLERVIGVRLPDSEMRAVAVLDSDGRMVPGTVSTSMLSQITGGVERLAFEKMRADALAIYARVSLRTVFPNYANFDAGNKALAERVVADLQTRARTSMGRFRAEVVRGRAVVLDPANHYLFLTNESEVVRLVRDFLAEVAAR